MSAEAQTAPVVRQTEAQLAGTLFGFCRIFDVAFADLQRVGGAVGAITFVCYRDGSVGTSVAGVTTTDHLYGIVSTSQRHFMDAVRAANAAIMQHSRVALGVGGC